MITPPALSIVAPMHNEAGIAEAFVARCAAVATELGVSWELLISDDASTDGTADVVRRAATAAGLSTVRVLRQPRNLGQIGATLAGLRAARGGWVVVLDGDLQDPPEVIADLWRRAQTAPQPSAVFAVKSGRDDPTWFMLSVAAFNQAQAVLGGTPSPRGAGAFCLIPGTLACRVARAQVGQANLAPLLMAVLARDGTAADVATVSYRKAARYDGAGRVGPVGLAREALGSLAISGALGRGQRLVAAATAATTAALLPTLMWPPLGLPLVLSGAWTSRRLWRAAQSTDRRTDEILRPTAAR